MLAEPDNRFDEPIIVPDGQAFEPVRYVAELPYDLTQYEFSILQETDQSNFWFGVFAGGTAGLLLAVVGKTAQALISNEDPSLEDWEMYSVLAGIVVCLLFKVIPSKKKAKRKKIENLVDDHFMSAKKRRIHIGGDAG